MKREALLKEEILKQYKSLRQFSQVIGLAPSTLTTILNNGIGGTSIDTIIFICDKLGLDINLMRKESVMQNRDYLSETELSYIKKLRALNQKSQEFLLGMIDDLYEQRELIFHDNEAKKAK